MQPLLLIGSGGHARSLIDIVESANNWEISALIGKPEEVGNTVLGYSVIGSDKDLPKLREVFKSAFVAIGQIGLSSSRHMVIETVKDLDFYLPTLISKHSIVSKHAKLGSGTSVGHGAIINADAIINDHCIINSQVLIEHGASIGSNCHISTGAIINGDAKIGDGSFIGSGAVIREGLKIPAKTMISAGKRVMGWPIINDIKP